MLFGFFFMVRLQVTLSFPFVPVITAVPTFFAFTTPFFETEAVFASEDVHVYSLTLRLSVNCSGSFSPFIMVNWGYANFPVPAAFTCIPSMPAATSIHTSNRQIVLFIVFISSLLLFSVYFTVVHYRPLPGIRQTDKKAFQNRIIL